MIFATLVLSACATTKHPPLQTAPYVDPDRFDGQWYVIANIPYFAERDKVDSRTIYKHRKGNLYDDIFISRDKSFDAKEDVLKGKVRILNENNTKWRSTFYWVVNFTFDVLHVEQNYQWMLLGHPSRDYGWIMAREKSLSDEDYQTAMSILAERGYDTARFELVPQFEYQLNQAKD